MRPHVLPLQIKDGLIAESGVVPEQPKAGSPAPLPDTPASRTARIQNLRGIWSLLACALALSSIVTLIVCMFVMAVLERGRGVRRIGFPAALAAFLVVILKWTWCAKGLKGFFPEVIDLQCLLARLNAGDASRLRNIWVLLGSAGWMTALGGVATTSFLVFKVDEREAGRGAERCERLLNLLLYVISIELAIQVAQLSSALDWAGVYGSTSTLRAALHGLAVAQATDFGLGSSLMLLATYLSGLVAIRIRAGGLESLIQAGIDGGPAGARGARGLDLQSIIPRSLALIAPYLVGLFAAAVDFARGIR